MLLTGGLPCDRISYIHRSPFQDEKSYNPLAPNAFAEAIDINRLEQQTYAMYQNQNGERNVKITFLSVRPTLAVRNYVQRVIRDLVTLGVPRKDIIPEVLPVTNYGDKRYQNDRFHTIVSGQLIKTQY